MKLVPVWVTSNGSLHHWAINRGPGATSPLTLCALVWIVADWQGVAGPNQCGNCNRTRIFKNLGMKPVTITRYGVLV